MKKILILTICLLTPSIAPAQTASHPISSAIAKNGLSATEAALTALPAPSPDEQFLLGGVRFLRGVERALQTRWRYGAKPMPDYIPILRVRLPENPNPEPQSDAMVAEIFEDALSDMQIAEQALAAIPENAEVGVILALNDLWFDININGKRDRGEGLLALQSMALSSARLDDAALDAMDETQLPLVRFDTADVAWLRAYTHLLSGASELVLSLDPTSAITKVRTARDRMDAMGLHGSEYLFYVPDSERWLDLLAMQVFALRHQPDPVRTRKARDHFLAMLAQNRIFWAKIAQETDNELEWIPADHQDSALGFDLPAGLGDRWLAILSDAERVLTGDLLISHWRFKGNVGINVAKFLEAPAPLDLIGWIHGTDALDYIEQGETISNTNWRAFERMVGRQGLMFALMLN